MASSGHGDPVAPVVMALGLILVLAKLGGAAAARLGQPSVLGELLVGVLMGNLTMVGFSGFEFLEKDQMIDILARLGVIILLFEVGLESTVGQMARVGISSFLVAVIGVVFPFGLGIGVGYLLLPNHSFYVYLFLGATLTATSVGITARVLRDLGESQSREAMVILGAAVIDDVLGLVILAVVTGVISAAGKGGEFNPADAVWILGKALGFLAGALVLGVWLSPRLFRLASRLQVQGVLLAISLAFCFLMAWLASLIELAPIVGAFAAGLILEEVHYESFKNQGSHQLEELIHPISSFLVPVFFVLMGMRVDLNVFGDVQVLGLAAGITVAAIVGKQACGLVAGGGMNRLAIGVGMIPRGEVGLIFANIGASLKIGGERVVSPEIYSAVVVMVLVTTMITPPALSAVLRRKLGDSAEEQVY